MIFTRVRVKNLFCFADADLDLTLRTQVAHSPVSYECLHGRESFYVRRLVVLCGANASGKTSLAKVLCSIQNFLYRRNIPKMLDEAITNKEEPAVIEVEFACECNGKPYLNYLKLELSHSKALNAPKPDKVEFARIYIRVGASASTARKALRETIENKGAKRNTLYLSYDYHKPEDNVGDKAKFESLDFGLANWLYIMSTFMEEMRFQPDKFVHDKRLLESILKTFDNSIDSVDQLHDSQQKPEGFVIRFLNGDPVNLTQKLEPSNKDRLSSGTLSAITLTHFFVKIYELYQNDILFQGTFYLDEQMAFVHSELEQHMLNALIAILPLQSQLFFTSHNYDIFDMNLPVHSFVLTRKRNGETEFVMPAKTFNKNDRSLVNYVKNDVFRTLPDTSLLDELLDEVCSQELDA